MLQVPLFGVDPDGLAKTVSVPVTMIVNDADGLTQPAGCVALAPGTYPRTIAVAELAMCRLPPKKPFTSGVRKVKSDSTLTVTVLPAPPPPVATPHAIAVPFGWAQVVVVEIAPSPRWPCA